MCQFLCGANIPKYILDLPSEILSTPLGQTLAPLIESIGAQSSGNSNFSYEPQIISPTRELSPDFVQINTQIEDLRQQSADLEVRRQQSLDKIAKKERKKDKKKRKEKKSGGVSSSEGSDYNSTGMSEIEPTNTNEANGSEGDVIPSEMLPSEQVLEDEREEQRQEEERKKNREPPIVFKEIDVSF